MAVQKIRIKLAAYDHELVDEAAMRIVETMKKSGAKISGPIPLPTEREIAQIQRFPRTIRDENVQENHRHLFSERETSRYDSPSRRRRHQDQTLIGEKGKRYKQRKKIL